MENKDLLPDPISICRKDLFTINLFNLFSTAVKLTKNDLLGFAFKCSNKLQSYLDINLVRNIIRNKERDHDSNQEEAFLNFL